MESAGRLLRSGDWKTRAIGVAAVLVGVCGHAELVDSSWVGGTGAWGVGSNWSPAAVPNNGADVYSVVVATENDHITLDMSPTVQDVTIDQSSARLDLGAFTLTTQEGLFNAGAFHANHASSGLAGSLVNTGTVTIDYDCTLTYGGGYVDNDGVIDVNPQSYNDTTTFLVNADTDLAGTGQLQLHRAGQAVLATGTGATLSQFGDHSIVGRGVIDAALYNEGTVDATFNANELTLQGQDKTNANLFRASVGTLRIAGCTIQQIGSGRIEATGGAVTIDDNTTIDGGLLSTSGSGTIATSIYATGVTLNSPTLTAGTTLDVGYGGTVDVAGATVTNEGTIDVNPNGSSPDTFLNFTENTSLEGTGRIRLSGSSDNAQLTSSEGATLTNSRDHSIEGRGMLHAALANQGTVSANVNANALYLGTNDKANGGLMTAVDGGRLYVDGIALEQSPEGRLVADNGSTVYINTGSSILGGSLETVGSGTIEVSQSATGVLLDSPTISSGSVVNGNYGTEVSVSGGSMSNDGTYYVNPAGASVNAILSFDETTALTGSGTIRMYGAGIRAQLNADTDVSLQQGTNHTISGRGNLNAALENQGMVNADVSNHTLALATNDAVNQGTMQATNSGILSLSVGVTQSPTGTILADGGTVQLRNEARVSGGTLQATTGSSIEIPYNQADVTLDGVTLPQDTSVNVGYGSTLNLTTSDIVNNGLIAVNPTSSSVMTTLNFTGNATVQGSGEIALGSNTYSRITALAGAVFENTANHTISGRGAIDAGMLNSGTVRSDAGTGTLVLSGEDKTNAGSLIATNGATLQIGCNLLQQGSGYILADNATVRFLGNSTVTDGLFTAANGGGYAINANTGTANPVTLQDVAIENGVALEQGYASTLRLAGTGIQNDGTLVVNSTGSNADTYLDVVAPGALGGSGEVVLNHNTRAYVRGEGTPLVNDPGHTIRGKGRINDESIDTFDNGGTVIADGGTLTVNGAVTQFNGDTLTGGVWRAEASSTLSLPDETAIATNQGTVVLNGAGSNFEMIEGIHDNQGTFGILGGRSFTTTSGLLNSGTVEVGTGSTLTVSGTYTQTGSGQLIVDGIFSAASTTVSGGTLSGSGSTGSAVSLGNGATVSPGSSTGTLGTGDFTFEAGSGYVWELGDTLLDYDTMNVDGEMILPDGEITVTLENLGALDPTGQSFALATWTGTDPVNVPTWNLVYGGGSGFQGGQITFTNDGSPGGSLILSDLTYIPEPGSALLAALALVAFLRRRGQ